jgi:hypothetical protein
MVKLNKNLLHCMAIYNSSLMHLAYMVICSQVADSSNMTASEKFTGSNPKRFKNIFTFGGIGITCNNQKIKGKLDNQGYPCMFVKQDSSMTEVWNVKATVGEQGRRPERLYTSVGSITR